MINLKKLFDKAKSIYKQITKNNDLMRPTILAKSRTKKVNN